jgi:hypothetical protein
MTEADSAGAYLDPDATKPRISVSYPDMVRYSWSPLEDIKAEVTLVVYSSRLALQQIRIQNLSLRERTVDLAVYLRHPSQNFTSIRGSGREVFFRHREPADRWTASHQVPHVENVQDVFLVQGDGPYTPMTFSDPRLDQGLLPALTRNDFSGETDQSSPTIAFLTQVHLLPRAISEHRCVRGVAPSERSSDTLVSRAKALLDLDLAEPLRDNERLFADIENLLPKGRHASRDLRLLSLSAWSLVRQMMLPPEGLCTSNYYVFSREPTWGWGHGGQVFHESLTMIPFARFDPVMAMESQRVYAKRQHSSGYINYRTGPYLDEQIKHEGELTTSAPWYAWQNAEIYSITQDREFLEQMYASSRRFYEWYTSRRDADGDGLCEWGGHAVLESVRDASVAVWSDVAWPSEFDALDLNCMLVMEAKALSFMAGELGLEEDARRLKHDAEVRSSLIRDRMWDDETGFFYHTDRRDDDFSHTSPDDLKRKEIIGFLPLWAGVATTRQARRLVFEHLLDPGEFWRPYGIPSLSADDSSYDPHGYWNGPIWVQWNDLVVRGLLDYGYTEEARDLTLRVADGMIAEARRSHTLWEFYSPDDVWGGWHQAYIWAAMINDMFYLVTDSQTNTSR